MKDFGTMVAETYASWLNSLASCWSPLSSCLGERRRHQGGSASSVLSLAAPEAGAEAEAGTAIEKDIGVYYNQPGFTPPPLFAPLGRQESRADRKERAPRKSLGSLSRGSFSVRRRFQSNASSTSSSRRPQISAPSNFRHLYSESFRFPQPQWQQQQEPQQQPQQPQQPQQSHSPPLSQAQARPPSFHPLELSIFRDRNLSPILPHFDYEHPDVTPPPPAHTHGSFDSDSSTLANERSYSSMSFHLPRRPLLEPSPSDSPDGSPPRIPARSRARAYTSPNVERIVERIASAMIERDRLQAEIESVLERQSIYVSSRPSTAHGLEEPMPSIPALPAAAPSFAERLSSERPHTAPSKPAHASPRDMTFEDASSPFPPLPSRAMSPRPSPSPRINGRPVDIPLAPPLPLVLRPPLRKKKSFSRVSNWLFPGGGEEGQHQREISLDSVTNMPRPVTDREGFYQTVAPPAGAERRSSIDTVTTVSTWTTEEDRTMPTTWSPGSSPVAKQETPTAATATTTTLDRRATFGRGGGSGSGAHRPQSVGVAF